MLLEANNDRLCADLLINQLSNSKDLFTGIVRES
jgi:hypothetical protein